MMEYFSLCRRCWYWANMAGLGRCDTRQPAAALHNIEIFYRIIQKYFQEFPPDLSMFLPCPHCLQLEINP